MRWIGLVLVLANPAFADSAVATRTIKAKSVLTAEDVAVDAGAYVSAVDPRGLPATGEAAVKLIDALKAKLVP